MLSNLFVLFMCWNDPPIVKTNLGDVKGEYRESVRGKLFSAFEGIPYAEPPVGELRFKDPLPPKKWPTVLNANFTYTCIQLTEDNTIVGSEDCLYLNIYIPGNKINVRNKFNVLIYIHSGKFSYLNGHNYTNPDYLMDNNIVLVTFNYRLGIFGFLSTEDHVVPGNSGLKDQVHAIKWIKDNIKYFGGNSDSITLLGLEAGAASVHYHYLSPMTKNLFQRGISQSGSALNPWSLQKDALHKAQKLAVSVECTINNIEAMINCLREKPADVLASRLILFKSKGFPLAPFGPVVEKHKSNLTFLPDYPYLLLLRGQVHYLPWIVGSVTNEGSDLVKNMNINEIKILWKMFAPNLLDFKNAISQNKWNSVSKDIFNYYFKFSSTKTVNTQIMSQILHDRLFMVDTELAIKTQAKYSRVYYYRFEYNKNSEDTSLRSDTKTIFPNTNVNLETTDIQMTDQLISMISSFASTGIPTLNNVNWRPVNSDKLEYLSIKSPDDTALELEKNYNIVKFWNNLGFKENQNLIKILT